MDKTFRFFIIVAVMMLIAYTGFEIYNSISGSESTFNETVVPLAPNLGEDVVEHINTTSSFMVYYENVDETDN